MKKYLFIAVLALVTFVAKAQLQVNITQIPDWKFSPDEAAPAENLFKIGMHKVQAIGKVFYAPLYKNSRGKIIVPNREYIFMAIMRVVGKDQYVKDLVSVKLQKIYRTDEEFINDFTGNAGQWAEGENGTQIFIYKTKEGQPNPMSFNVFMGRMYQPGYWTDSNSKKDPANWSNIMYLNYE